MRLVCLVSVVVLYCGLRAEKLDNLTAPQAHILSQEYYYLAHHFEQLSNKVKAKELYTKAIAFDTTNYTAHAQLAALYYHDNDIMEALTHFQAAFIYHPHDAHILFNIGQCYIKQEQWHAAYDYLHKTITVDPAHERAYFHLGKVCEKLQCTQEAMACYQKAIAINPDAYEAYLNMGVLYKHLEQLDQAMIFYRHAYRLQPNNTSIMMELANILHMLDHNQEALELYEKIVEKNPQAFSALYNFGFTLKKMGYLDRAATVYRQLLTQKPDFAPAHFSLSSIYLTQGDLERGWEEYEWRWQAYNEKPRTLYKPLWNGEDIVGRTLFVYAEQGLGDTLQFIRYLKLLKQKYRHVYIVFEAQDALVPLLKQQPYIDRVISRHEQPPYFHYQIPLLSLPYVLKTRLDTIPADIPYIAPSAHLVTTWQKKLATDKNVKVGLCWQGNAHYTTQALRRAVALKSISLADCAPLFEIPGVSLYSLQQCDGIEQIATCPFKDTLITFDNSFDTTYGRFMDTAAVISNLDVVISVDTSIAHLAAAMGKQTWLLLPTPSDWRWLLQRTDSPWYPSIRLFRQPTAGDWHAIIEEVAQELSFMAHHQQHVRPTSVPADTAVQPTEDQRLFFKQIALS